MGEDEGRADDALRRIRWHLGQAEDQLDVVASRLARARELLRADDGWCSEYLDDLVVIRSKLDSIGSLIPRRRTW